MPIIQGPPSSGRSAGAARAKPAATPASKVTYVLARPAAAGGAGAAYSGPSAADQAQQILGPQEQQQNLYAAHQNAVIQSFARSLLGKLQPVAGQVGADYNQAIQQIGGLSGQAAQYLSGQNPSPVQQALTSSVGAPPEQQAQEAAQLGNTFRGGAGVLAFTQGVVPGSELAGNKAAAQSSARQLPGIAALKGQQDLASALWQQSQDRATLEATRPKLVSDAQSNIDTANYRNAQLGLSQQKLTDAEHTAAVNADYKNRALVSTNVYRQGLLDQSQQRIGLGQQQVDLGYTKVAQTAKDKAADRAATKTYHDSYLAHLTAGDSERVAHDKALEAATVTRNAIYRTSVNNAAIKQNNANAPKYSASVSRSLGFRADQFGNPIDGGAVLPGFTRGKNGAIVKTSSSTSKLSTSASGRYGYQIDTSGKPILRNGAKIPYPKSTGAAARPLTAPESTKFTKSATQIATNAANGATDSKGVHHPPISREQAQQEMRLAGLFADPRTAKIAMQALGEAYGPPGKTVRSKGLGVTATFSP